MAYSRQQYQTRRRRKRRRPLKVFFYVTLLFATFLIGHAFGSRSSTDSVPTAHFPYSATSTNTLDNFIFPHFTAQVPITEITDTQYLKLVNRDRAVAMTNYSQLVTAWPDIPVRATYIQIHETAMHAMLRLFEAAERANIDNLFITSGFRSYDEQSRLYENAANSAYVMRPGHSEHQLGLAADILSTNSTAEMIGTQEAQWLAENAPQFGLILRYPYDKHDITNVPYEPWHFRYVGRVHAWIMGQYGFVLEEYIEFLQEHGNYTTTFENQAFYISYQKPRNGILFVPEHLDFTVSSANTGGYIVTAWE